MYLESSRRSGPFSGGSPSFRGTVPALVMSFAGVLGASFELGLKAPNCRFALSVRDVKIPRRFDVGMPALCPLGDVEMSRARQCEFVSTCARGSPRGLAHEHEAGSFGGPLKIYSFKRKIIPKIAVLATGLTAAVLVATISPTPAQAYPAYAATCTNCHTAGGSVSATPSTATVAPGAAFTVAIAFTGGTSGSNSGYWISGNSVSLTGGPAAVASYAVAMTAPASAGTYTYLVWMRQGVTASKSFSITVAPVVTTPPPTTIPPTTVPPTTVPPTTVPPTTVPPTTVPPTDNSGNPWSPTGVIGTGHLSMYSSYGKMACTSCHNGAIVPKPPTLLDSRADMKKASCSSCHASGGKEKRAPLFISLMNNPSQIAYGRCSDCHRVIAADGTGGLLKK